MAFHNHGFYIKCSEFSNNAVNTGRTSSLHLPDPVFPPVSLLACWLQNISRSLLKGLVSSWCLWSSRGSEETTKTRVHLGTFWRIAADVLSLWNEWVDKFTFLFLLQGEDQTGLNFLILDGEHKRGLMTWWKSRKAESPADKIIY